MRLRLGVGISGGSRSRSRTSVQASSAASSVSGVLGYSLALSGTLSSAVSSASGVLDFVPLFTPASLTNLKLWLKADTGVTLVSGKVSSWGDQSGQGNNFTQSNASFRPTVSAASVGGRDAISFDATALTSLIGPNFSALTAGEIFIVYQLAVDPPVATEGAIWYFGTSGIGDVIPYADGHIYDGFGSASRYDTGVRSGTPFDASTGAIYNVISTATEWTNNVNGVQQATTGSAIVGFNSAPTLGATLGVYGTCKITEVAMCSSKQSTGDRASMISYLKDRHGIA